MPVSLTEKYTSIIYSPVLKRNTTFVLSFQSIPYALKNCKVLPIVSFSSINYKFAVSIIEGCG